MATTVLVRSHASAREQEKQAELRYIAYSQLPDCLRGLPLGGFGEKVLCREDIRPDGQQGQELAFEVGMVLLTFAGFPHMEKLGFAIGAVAKGGVGQPSRVSIDAAQYGKMIVLAVLEVYHHGYLEFGQLLIAGGKALGLESELRQGALHVLETGAKVAFIHGLEQFFLRNFTAVKVAFIHGIKQFFFRNALTVEFVQQGCQGRGAAGVVQVLLDDAGIAEGFPALDGYLAGK